MRRLPGKGAATADRETYKPRWHDEPGEERVYRLGTIPVWPLLVVAVMLVAGTSLLVQEVRSGADWPGVAFLLLWLAVVGGMPLYHWRRLSRVQAGIGPRELWAQDRAGRRWRAAWEHVAGADWRRGLDRPEAVTISVLLRDQGGLRRESIGPSSEAGMMWDVMQQVARHANLTPLHELPRPSPLVEAFGRPTEFQVYVRERTPAEDDGPAAEAAPVAHTSPTWGSAPPPLG